MYDGAGRATIYGRNDLLAAGLARLGTSPKQAEGDPQTSHRGIQGSMHTQAEQGILSLAKPQHHSADAFREIDLLSIRVKDSGVSLRTEL